MLNTPPKKRWRYLEEGEESSLGISAMRISDNEADAYDSSEKKTE